MITSKKQCSSRSHFFTVSSSTYMTTGTQEGMEKEKKELGEKIQIWLDTIKEKVNNILKDKSTELSLWRYGDNIDEEGKLISIYYHTIALYTDYKSGVTLNHRTNVSISICFSDLSKKSEIEKIDKLIIKKVKE